MNDRYIVMCSKRAVRTKDLATHGAWIRTAVGPFDSADEALAWLHAQGDHYDSLIPHRLTPPRNRRGRAAVKSGRLAASADLPAIPLAKIKEVRQRSI